MKEVDSRSWNSSGAEEEEKRGSVEAGGYLRAVQSISPKFRQQHSSYIYQISSKKVKHVSMLRSTNLPLR